MGCTPSRNSAASIETQEKGSLVGGCGVDIVRYRAELVFYHMREAERWESKVKITESKEMGEKTRGRERGRKMEEGVGVGDDYFSYRPRS